MQFNRALINIGVHGQRHRISHSYICIIKYKYKKAMREKKLIEWLHNNGLGA